MRQLSRPEVNDAWRNLDPVGRASLELVRAFDGVIVPDFDDCETEEVHGP